MTEDSSNTHAKAAELEKTSDYVKDKIKAQSPKTDGTVTRARAKRREIYKLAEKLIDRLEPHRRAAVQVWIDGMKATKPIYEKGRRVGEEPDWKERRENAALIIAYLEGKPIEKQIQARGDFEDLQALMDAVKQTTIGQEMLAEDDKEVPRPLA